MSMVDLQPHVEVAGLVEELPFMQDIVLTMVESSVL